jgi:hypothetical protein
MKGNLERAAAWQDFLDGECLPPEADFVDTQRSAGVHSTKILMPIFGSDGAATSVGSLSQNPRTIADPMLANLCERLITGFNSLSIVGLVEKDAFTISMSDLGMDAIDIVLGGKREFQLLVRQRVLLLNGLPIDAACNISVEPDQNVKLFAIFAQAELLNRLIQRNRSGQRWLVGEPGIVPLFGNVTPDQLDEGKSHKEIIGRADGLNAFIGVFAMSTNQLLNNSQGSVDEGLLHQLVRQCIRLRLDTNPPGGTDGTASGEQNRLQAWLKNLSTELMQMQDDLQNSIQLVRVLPLQESKTKGTIESALSVLESVGGKSALSALIPYYLKGENQPNPQWSFTVPAELSTNSLAELRLYNSVRPAVSDALDLARPGAELRLHGNKEGEPLTIYLLEEGRTQGVSLAWLKVDQWDEFVPNPMERSAVAFQYDTPNSEPPNVVLLAAPPEIDPARKWDSDLLARTILEVTDLMKVRAVGSADVIGSNDLGRYLPALLFGPSPNDYEIAPSIDRKLESPANGEPFYYKKAIE